MRYDIGRCRITELLEARGWSQRLFAEKSGVSEQTISSYTRELNPRKNMTLEVALALSDTLGIHPRELFELKPVRRRR